MSPENWIRPRKLTSSGNRVIRGRLRRLGIWAQFTPTLERLDKFLEQTRKALRLDPDYYAIYANLGAAYMNLNWLDEAEQSFKVAEQRGLAAETLLQFWYQLDFVRGNATGMAQMVAAAAGKPGTRKTQCLPHRLTPRPGMENFIMQVS